jgi:sugar/nucleoside kinase (ribokinase family)
MSSSEKASEEVDIATPAFNVTKVMGTVGAGIAALAAALPAALVNDHAVIIAAIAAATAIILGVIALSAVDVKTRQRAHEAAMRWGGQKPTESAFQAMPSQDVILQMGHNKDEYEVRYASVENGSVHVFAERQGDPVSVTFKKSPKP